MARQEAHLGLLDLTRLSELYLASSFDWPKAEQPLTLEGMKRHARTWCLVSLWVEMDPGGGRNVPILPKQKDWCLGTI